MLQGRNDYLSKQHDQPADTNKNIYVSQSGTSTLIDMVGRPALSKHDLGS